MFTSGNQRKTVRKRQNLLKIKGPKILRKNLFKFQVTKKYAKNLLRKFKTLRRLIYQTLGKSTAFSQNNNE